jgi:DNA-binding protein H-NS
MSTTLHELHARIAELQEEVKRVQSAARVEGIQKIRALMAEYGISVDDLGAQSAKRGKTGKVAAKYRHRSTGESWSGRGLKPKWLEAAIAQGAKIEDFAV